jgi:hypothetical protein
LPAAIIARLILVLEWLATTFDIAGRYQYYYFKNTYCFGRLDVLAAVVVAIAGIFYWFYIEYKKQLICTTAE